MKLNYFPMCCGARILMGLHNNPYKAYIAAGQVSPDLIMNKIMQANWAGETTPRQYYAGYQGDMIGDIFSPVSKVFLDRPWAIRTAICPSNWHHTDHFPYIPDTLLGFHQALRRITSYDSYGTGHVSIGTIIAITAPGEDDAVGFLKATAFKETISTDKSYPGNARCMTWVANWWDIRDILRDVPSYDFSQSGTVKEVKTRFG